MSSKTIRSGDNRYDVSDSGGQKVVTTPTWTPGKDEHIATTNDEESALSAIKSDSGSRSTKED